MRINRNISLSQTNLFGISVLIGCIIIALLNYLGMCGGSILLSYLILANIWYLYKFRNTQFVEIMLLFAMTYWLYLIPYYFFGIDYSAYKTYLDGYYSDGTLRIIGIFFVFLFSFANSQRNKGSLSLPRRDNKYIVAICMCIMALICLMVYCVGDAFSYTSGNNNSTLYEYYFVFALCAYAYDLNDDNKKLFIILNVVYILGLLRLGLRLVVLELVLMLFILYLENRYKNRYIYGGAIVAFLFLSLWAWVRHGMFSDIESIGFLLGFHDNHLVTNQGDVFYTSTAQYAQLCIGYWDEGFRIESLVAFLKNIFHIGGSQYEIGILNRVLNATGKVVGGGGFGAMYAYVWLGFVGVIFLSIFLACCINNINSLKGYVGKYYGVFVSFTFFRWYAYSLAIVFKMGFYLVLCLIIFKTIDNSMRVRSVTRM